MTDIILASASPRRRELLTRMGLPFLVLPSNAEEACPEKPAHPKDLVLDLSFRKAAAVAERIDAGKAPLPEAFHREDYLVLGADTVVAIEGDILGKPAHEKAAVQMLSRLQGKDHAVYTGVTLLHRRNGRETIRAFAEKTTVSVSPMKAEEIAAYVREGESCDKAGAYGIQGSFCRFIRKIDGDFFNVVGLPAAALYRELQKIL